jgi:hypothetical protein
MLFVVGIVQTTAVHAYNIGHLTEGLSRSDIFPIILGICGSIIIVVGIVFFARPKKRRP